MNDGTEIESATDAAAFSAAARRVRFGTPPNLDAASAEVTTVVKKFFRESKEKNHAFPYQKNLCIPRTVVSRGRRRKQGIYCIVMLGIT